MYYALALHCGSPVLALNIFSNIYFIGDWLQYNILISKADSGWYTVECLNLPGCISQGQTKKEALENIKDAIKGYLVSLKKHPEDFVYKSVEEIRAISIWNYQ